MNKKLIQYAKTLSVYIVDHIPIEEDYLLSFLNAYYDKIGRNSDAKSAIESLRNTHYDIVLFSSTMKSMNSQTFIKEIQKTNIKSVLVMSIQEKDVTSIVTYIKLNIKHYVLKPFNNLQLEQLFEDISQNIFEKKAIYTKSHKLAKFILDSQVNINILTNGQTITYANSAFYRFFTDIKTTKEFEAKYKSIGNLFEEVDKEDYVYNGKDGKDWLKYIVDRKSKQNKAQIIKDDVLYIFAIKLDINAELKEFVVSFVDITDMEAEAQTTKSKLTTTTQKLQDQELIALKNYKLAYIDELLDHIEHQVNRPIYTIKAINQEMYEAYKNNSLSNYELYMGLKQINAMTNAIKHNISNFQTFHQLVKQNGQKARFNIKQAIYNTVMLIDEGFSKDNVDIETKINKAIVIDNCEALLNQAILVLLIHSKDKMIAHNTLYKKIFIEVDNNIETYDIKISHSSYELDTETAFENNYDLLFVKNIVTDDLKGVLTVENCISDDIDECTVFVISLPK